MSPNPQFPADLLTFTEEILNGKIHFFDVNLVVNSWVFLFLTLISIIFNSKEIMQFKYQS